MTSDTGANTLEAHGDWKQAIGRFIVHFAECELWVTTWARTWFPAAVAEEIVKFPLERRAGLVRAMLLSRDTGVDKTDTGAVFSELRQLAAFRNLIAHNPPLLSIVEGTDASEEVRLQVRLTSMRDTETQATLSEIVAKGTAARLLADRMQNMQMAMLSWNSFGGHDPLDGTGEVDRYAAGDIPG
jgi:hypothetical protein